MSFLLEDPEIEKPKDSSVFTPAKRDLTLPPESEPREESGKELEEEDDLFYLIISKILLSYIESMTLSANFRVLL